jgi:hypothetical protein
MDALAVTVYLSDLLMVGGIGDRLNPEPIQLVSGHCRFTFPMSVAELMGAPTRGLSEWLVKMKRVGTL